MYKPTAARSQVRRSALRHLVQTFFDGSPTSAVAALLEMADGELSASDRAKFAKMIAHAKTEGR
jgi:predicted transcriptional regulator